ncbi:hypothetical protein [Candidatus Xianfuyuplasma coldseepsis]|uniref:Uncharacterized protein n=1 Tax=Candidatus Xianfuyuplasma coldseepsis TaxID=2782163 RepID=A0A7L7KT14_9MOLU|nr:hypothetical protein [Xianfuyuplasma coldseepsis]QMS85745.1 hypothetical protein G4Z02_08310 [Xianfuyuplasma coldseepsis]
MILPTSIIFILASLFYILSIGTHVLVLMKKIPFQDVNGGRSSSFEEQKKQSQVSIVVLGVLFVYVLSAKVFPAFRTRVIYLIASSLLALFWLLGTVMQLLGTRFEKRIMVWINVIGLISHIELVLLYVETE